MWRLFAFPVKIDMKLRIAKATSLGSPLHLDAGFAPFTERNPWEALLFLVLATGILGF